MSHLDKLKKAVEESEKGRKNWHSMLGTKKEFKKHLAKKMKGGYPAKFISEKEQETHEHLPYKKGIK